MIISLGNGKSIHKSVEEVLSLRDEDIDMWYQNMIADDLGDESLSPFAPFKDVQLLDFEIPDIEEE